jgi:hypothetical protein
VERRRHADGDEYLDLIEAVLRGAIEGDNDLGPNVVRERYTVELGTWDRMMGDLLGQLGADAGSVKRALVHLGLPSVSLLDEWLDGGMPGTTASARWVAVAIARGRLHTRRERGPRGEDYSDLIDAAIRGGVTGDGSLDPTRLREQYTVDAGPWLRMVGDLLAQVVGDSGSLEQASVVLAVPLRTLAAWVRWLVSGGSSASAWSTWPLATQPREPSQTYDDLVDAVVRGAVVGDGEPLEGPQLQESYVVRFGDWDEMIRDLLLQVVADAGSARRAARAVGVPRSTFSKWVGRLARP